MHVDSDRMYIYNTVLCAMNDENPLSTSDGGSDKSSKIQPSIAHYIWFFSHIFFIPCILSKMVECYVECIQNGA